jgi:hypothetical protein
MKLKTLFVINAIVVILNGIGSVVVPDFFMSLYGATLDAIGRSMMQFGGAWLIGLGLLAWLVRDAEESETRRSIVTGFMLTYLVGLVVSVIGALSGAMNYMAWSPVGINVVLSLGYAYFLFAKPKNA